MTNTNLEDRILSTLSRGACLTNTVIAERLGVANPSILRALKRLQDRGAVIGWRPSQKERTLIWATTDDYNTPGCEPKKEGKGKTTCPHCGR